VLLQSGFNRRDAWNLPIAWLVNAFEWYRLFYGLLLLAFLATGLTGSWQEVQREVSQSMSKAALYSKDIVAATVTVNGCLRFLEKALFSPLGLVAGVIYVCWRLQIRVRERKLRNNRFPPMSATACTGSTQ
jgi:hypothetical protein